MLAHLEVIIFSNLRLTFLISSKSPFQCMATEL